MAMMNGTGQGGKSFQDRELAAKVRSLALGEIKTILEDPEMTEFKKQILLRLAGSILPRLNAGRDDHEPLIPTSILGGATKQEDEHQPVS